MTSLIDTVGDGHQRLEERVTNIEAERPEMHRIADIFSEDSAELNEQIKGLRIQSETTRRELNQQRSHDVSSYGHTRSFENYLEPHGGHTSQDRRIMVTHRDQRIRDHTEV